ncbi:tetratricopeptide repeat protein [Saccharopolyspora flava]|uniref:Tetratricopeptide (TPR) repeat n=1 Tax=Saccharopolyspora flava TaxID=95161 RepID=A0A1I6RU58_9PSEU|nr:tetratricopeptide repeat protein [Saccharopolyspora flava]SFS67988.1 Tetratricopeptide (TPR) repeat [Saccharopolyspora flava]
MDFEQTGAIANAASGHGVGNLVQAGVVHGDVHVHAAERTRTSPSQRPRAPRHFVNRVAETEKFQDLLSGEAPGPTVVVISGAGGVGKSALAARWVPLCRSRFPDGSLHADLGAFSSSRPTRVSQVLESFLRSLGCEPDSIPADLDQLAAMYRDVTAGRKLVVCLDDAFSAAQVRPLIPPESLVLVTSRYRLPGLALDGAHFVELPPLHAADSVELLRSVLGEQRVGRESGAAERMADLCAGFPVALMVAASRLTAHRKWTLRRMTADLEDERNRLPSLTLRGDVSVRAVFDLSYRKLSAEQAELYRVLSCHPGTTFGADVAAAAVERPREEVVDSLEALVEASLLDEVGDDRFRFHDLLRLHASDCATEAGLDRREVLGRFVAWYLNSAYAADRLVTPGRWYLGEKRDAGLTFTSATEALDWLDEERLNLVFAQREAREQGWREVVWCFGEAMWSLFVYRKHYGDWLETTRLAVDAASGENVRAESRLRGQLGHALGNLHRFDEAERELLAAARLAEAADDPRSQATAASRLGILARHCGKLDEALVSFRRALEIDLRVDDRRGAALRLRRIGETLTALGRHDDAIAELSRSVDLMLELPDPGGAARVSTRLGEAFTAAGRPRDAVGPLHEALAVLREIGSDFYVAELLVALAAAHEAAGEIAQARTHLGEACELHERIGGPHAEPLRKHLTELE